MIVFRVIVAHKSRQVISSNTEKQRFSASVWAGLWQPYPVTH